MPPVCARRTRHVDERTRWQGRASGSVPSPESRSMDSGFGSPEMAIPAPILALAHGCPVRVVLNRPGIRGGSLPWNEDESYEWFCGFAPDAAAVLEGDEGAGGPDGPRLAGGDGRRAG